MFPPWEPAAQSPASWARISLKFPHSRIITLVPIFIFLTTIEIPALLMLLYWFVIQFFSGIGSIGYSNVSRGGVAWFAHVGGFLAGWARLS